ncbi:MAG: hypothetical protein WC209_01080 [Ignavibacteriaceae bacterium]
MQKLILSIILATLFMSCSKEESNPISNSETKVEKGKTTVLIENGLIDDRPLDWTIITLLTSKVTVENPDPSVYFAMSETSPKDTFVILSNGVVNSKINSGGIPIADNFWGIQGYFQKSDTGKTTVDLYYDLGYYSITDSIILEPYKLISNTDTISMDNKYLLYWKLGYRIDTLKFNVFYKSNLELNYNRFSTSSMNLAYKTAKYDTTKRIASFIVGVPTLTSEPNIVLQPFGKVDFIYENSFIKVISRFNYQEQTRIGTWPL